MVMVRLEGRVRSRGLREFLFSAFGRGRYLRREEGGYQITAGVYVVRFRGKKAKVDELMDGWMDIQGAVEPYIRGSLKNTKIHLQAKQSEDSETQE